MNVSLEHPLPVEECVQKWTAEAEDFARRDPTKAVAVAFGLGVALNVLPKRLIVGAAAFTGITLLRPVLLSLGVLKAFEMCCPSKPKSSHPNPQPPIL